MTPIICEGPDLGGKSTIVKKLCKYYKRDSYHFTGPPKSQTELYSRLHFYLNNPQYIYDRCPMISEIVYGWAIRGDTLIKLKVLLKFLANSKPIIIYCRPPTDYLKSQFHIFKIQNKPHKSKAHIDSVIKNYDEIIRLYDMFFNRYNEFYNTLEFDFRDPIYKLIREIKDHEH